MMQSEFEELLGRPVDHKEYEKIESVYMAFEKMSKQEIADLYKRDGEFVTNALYDYVADTDRIIIKKDAKIDELQKCIIRCNETMDKMASDNDQLQKENKYLKDMAFKLTVRGYKDENSTEMLKTRIEELETQLHQYRALFADIEKSMTVSLYSALLGIEK